MSVSVLEKIEQYQKSIEKYHQNEEKQLYYIKKLSQLPVTVAHLQATGVGRTINSLRKSSGDVRTAAKNLVSKWKDMVAAEEAEEEEPESKAEEVVPETKYSSPEGNGQKRRNTDYQADHSDKKRRKDYSPEHHSHRNSLGQSRNSHHHRDRDDDRRRERSPEKKKASSPRIAPMSPGSPDNVYENGHYSESDGELRIEDDRDEESPPASDVEPARIQRNLSHDSAHHSSDGESAMKALSSKSSSHKDSKHNESSKHHHDKDKSSRKDRSSSSHKSKEEKKEKSEKSHRKHEKHKSKDSSKEDEKRSPKKSHSSSSKSKDKESRSKESSDKSSSKSKSEKSVVKIKQEPVDTYEVQAIVKQESVDKYNDNSSPEKAEKSESRKSSSSSSKSDKDKRKSSGKERSKEKKEEKKSSQKEKMRDLEDEGVDSFSGASFGDVLGMIKPTKSSKKKSLSSPSTSRGVAGYDPERPDLNYEKVKSKIDRDMLDSQSEEESYSYSSIRPSAIAENLYLPEISPHYRPLPQVNYSISPTKKVVSDDEALSHIISSKQMRTKVYSGSKTGYSHVPTLFEICTRVLQDNIEALGFTGGVPFDLLKPVLEHATAEQLSTLEHYNPYLIEDTDAIWQFHCQKDFRNKKREEMESWRDMYLRCVDEREQKLKSLTSSIQNSMSKWTPVRKTKLAYVEGTVKPPRGVARKQAKYGIPEAKPPKSSALIAKPSTSSASSSATTSSSFGGRQNVMAAPTVSVPNPRAGSSNSSSGSLKPKPKAPLMQKALQLVRNRYKR